MKWIFNIGADGAGRGEHGVPPLRHRPARAREDNPQAYQSVSGFASGTRPKRFGAGLFLPNIRQHVTGM
jgi:hypothetical protein